MIRKIQKIDIEQCMEIAIEVFKEEGYSFDILKELLCAFDTEDEQYTRPEYYVYEIEGTVVGFAGLSNVGFDNDIYGLFSCYVSSHFRFQGIGKALVEKRIENIKEKGAEMILCTTTKPWHLERFGFKAIDEKLNHKWKTMYLNIEKNEDA